MIFIFIPGYHWAKRNVIDGKCCKLSETQEAEVSFLCFC
jgi:hypothetical protein